MRIPNVIQDKIKNTLLMYEGAIQTWLDEEPKRERIRINFFPATETPFIPVDAGDTGPPAYFPLMTTLFLYRATITHVFRWQDGYSDYHWKADTEIPIAASEYGFVFQGKSRRIRFIYNGKRMNRHDEKRMTRLAVHPNTVWVRDFVSSTRLRHLEIIKEIVGKSLTCLINLKISGQAIRLGL